MTVKMIVGATLAYLLMMAVVPFLYRVATKFGWVDIATSTRKIHTGKVPLIGGLAIAASAVITTLVMGFDIFANPLIPLLMTGGLTLLLTGMIDDRIVLSPYVKLAIQGCCAYFLVTEGVYLDAAIDYVLVYELPIVVKQIITIIFIVGVVNAYNLIDGIDGLAGSLFVLAFAWFILLFSLMDVGSATMLSMVFASATIGFIKHNISADRKIFLGDGGSLFLGFIVAGLSIHVIEQSAELVLTELVIVGTVAVLLVPVLDAARVFALRMRRGQSPFYPDRSHIHHLLLTINSSHTVVRYWIMGIACLQLAVALISLELGGFVIALVVVVSLALFIVGTITVQAASYRQHRIRHQMEP